MRRAVVLLLLLGLMSGVSLLKAEGTGDIDPLTLAAIGFVVLTSFSAAELGNRLGLPRVTGYILSGLLLGPSMLDILSRPVVAEMRMFNTLALGLIATAAGLELDIGPIRAVGRTLLATVGAKVVLCMVAVGGTAWAMYAAFGMPSVQVEGAGMALALVFGALAIGTSPAIVLAVLRDGQATGRLSDLVLGAAVLKDVVVVVVLAIALALAAAITGGGGLDIQVLVDVGEELGASVLAGALLGVLLIVYIRFVNSEMLLFISAMVLVVAEVARALHLELLLVFIAAGFVVRNFSKHSHTLHKPLEMVSLPVFVVFFTIAGASVDLAGTLQILPLALALFAARLLAYWGAARIGGRIGGESQVIVDRAFLAYLPQAGVTLGLVGLAAARLPELAAAITSAGMAVVALNLLVGPVALKSALRMAGELAGSAPAAAPAPVAQDERVDAEPVAAPEPDDERESLESLASKALEDPELAKQMGALARDLGTLTSAAIEAHFANWALAVRRAAEAALQEGDDAALRRWAETPHADHMPGHAQRARGLFEAVRSRLRALPVEATVEVRDDELSARPDDRALVRWRRWRDRTRRLLRLRVAPRRVPLRLSARIALEPEVAALCLELVAAAARALGGVTETLVLRAHHRLTHEDARRQLGEVLDVATRRMRADARHSLARGLTRTAELWRKVGGPELPSGPLRYSQVRPQIRLSLQGLETQPERWRAGVAAGQRCLQLVVALSAVRGAGREAIAAHVTEPSLLALGGAGRIVADLRAALAALAPPSAGEGSGSAPRSNPGQTPALQDDAAARTSPLAGLQPGAERGEVVDSPGPTPAGGLSRRLLDRDLPALEALLHGLRASGSIHGVAVGLRRSLQSMPESCTALRAATPISTAATPEALQTRRIDFRGVATETLLHGLLPRLDARLEATARTLALAAPRMREAVDVALYALENRAGGEDTGTAPSGNDLSEAFARADRRLGMLQAELEAAADVMRRESEADASAAFDQLQSVAAGTDQGLSASDAAGTLASRVRERARALVAPQVAALRRAGTAITEIRKRVLASRLGVEWQARTARAPIDAIGMRRHAQRWSHISGLADSYQRLFEPRPVREHRLFTAHRDVLEALLTAEREWSTGGTGCPILLVGERGSGRTSMLNMCELELKVTRLLRLDPAASIRRDGLEAALALELGCRPQTNVILRALRSGRAAVLVDDLERWVKPASLDLAGLGRFLELVGRTRGSVLWIVATTPAAARLLSEVQPLAATFPQVVELKPLGHEALRTAVETRHRLSGRDLAYPNSLPARLFGRLSGHDDASLFFRVAGRSAGGNLTRAMITWLRAVEIGRDDVVRPSLPRALSLGLPPFSSLDPLQVTLLLCALRFGGVSPPRLESLLGVSLSVLSQHAAFLLAAGLLEPCAPPRDELQVPAALVGPVIQGLRELGVQP